MLVLPVSYHVHGARAEASSFGYVATAAPAESRTPASAVRVGCLCPAYKPEVTADSNEATPATVCPCAFFIQLRCCEGVGIPPSLASSELCGQLIIWSWARIHHRRSVNVITRTCTQCPQLPGIRSQKSLEHDQLGYLEINYLATPLHFICDDAAWIGTCHSWSQGRLISSAHLCSGIHTCTRPF